MKYLQRHVRFALVAMMMLAPLNNAHATFLGPGPKELLEIGNSFIGKQAEELFSVLGFPSYQHQVLDDYVVHGGFDSDNGPSCSWEARISKDHIVKDFSVYGNISGCSGVVKNARKIMRNRDK